MRAFALTLIGALALILTGPAAFAADPPATPAASGPLTGVVDEGVVAPTPIATPAFNGADPASQALGDQIAQVVAADLERSGYFAPIDRNAYIDKNLDINIQPRFDDWKKINAQALINGQAAIESDGRIRVDFRLWDVFSEQALLGVQLTATQDNWRRVAHKIADAVYSRLTGNGPYFDTRIVFVAESGARGHRVKRLEIMDQDGANPSFPPTGGETILTPRFSSNSQKIVYMALTDSATNIYVLDLETGRRESLGEFKGVVFAPRFSPDGLKVAFSISQYGNTDIYTIDLRTREIKRLTVDPSIDTSPCFTPDGGTIIFNSDRSGQPQIYAMNVDGTNVRRISFGSGRYHTPVVSPKGDLIAFTKQEGNRFSIGVMKLDGTGEKLLSSSFAQEGPTWAPNGRYLMFFREPVGGSPRLWTIDVTGRVERPAPYPGAASDPSWSALLN